MTDINFDEQFEDRADKALPLIELLFFAYRDFVGEPDEVLAELGFGRAHHRVLHFVYRNPGLSVGLLLEILQITKQSLGRVLRQLVEAGYIEQHEGPDDRRQRLLFATKSGADLASRLIDIQSARISRALGAVEPGDQAKVEAFLRAVMDEASTPVERASRGKSRPTG